MPAAFYLSGLSGFFSGDVDFNSDTLKVALLGAGYTPDLDVHDFFDDVAAQEVTGIGYVAGGNVLASAAVQNVPAASWSTVWTAATDYAADDKGVGFVVRPSVSNGYLYRVVTAGTSAGSEPTWPTTVGAVVVDGGVTWSNIGRAAVVLSGDDVTWAGSTLGVRYAVLYKSTGTAAASRLLALYDPGALYQSTNGAFTITWNSQGIAIAGVR